MSTTQERMTITTCTVCGDPFARPCEADACGEVICEEHSTVVSIGMITRVLCSYHTEKVDEAVRS